MARRWFFTSLLAGLATATAVVSVLRLAAPAPPNVLIVTVEGARADAFSAATTPNLWSAARSGTRFTRHRAVSAWTVPNVIALLAGVSPFDQGVHTRGNSVPRSWLLPLEELADDGWRVGGLQAFMKADVFRFLGPALEPGADPLRWMARRRADGDRFVLWYHYLGTHLPYAPTEPFRPDWRALLPPADEEARARIETIISQGVVPAGSVAFRPTDEAAVDALYRGGFREFDAWFAGLWDFLQRSGLIADTIVVVTADHGEELLERGNVGHASTTRDGHLHEELVRTPLIAWLPRRLGVEVPATVDAPSTHLDVMPTVMALLDQRPARPLPGSNLFALPPDRPWMAVTSQAGFAEPDPKHLRRFVFSRLEYPWKLHLDRIDGRTVRRRLYNLADDPGERLDLAARRPERVRAIGDRLLPAILAMRPPSAGTLGSPSTVQPPRWIFPASSRAYAYDDLGGRFRLEWAGPADADYIIQYVAGEGLLKLEGEMQVRGTQKDFGIIGRRYWDTWIVPYGRFRIRVGVAGAEAWSDWLDLVAKS